MKLELFLVFFLVPLCLGQKNTTPPRSPRTPQGHIEYNDPDGYKVSWKIFAPYTQWRSYLDNTESHQKTEQAETVPEPKQAKSQETEPVEKQQQQQQQQPQPQIEQPVAYKPYSMVPTYIKQLIYKMYEPQGPYVDPRVYIYHTPLQYHTEDQIRSVQSQSQSDRIEQKADKRQETVSQEKENDEQPAQQKNAAYQQAIKQEATNHQQPSQERTAGLYPEQQSLQKEASGQQQANDYRVSGYEHPALKTKAELTYDKYPVKEGDVEYKNENSESKMAQHESVPQQTAPQSELPAGTIQNTLHTYENNMPSLLQQLLHLQAQTPYYVIADRISYKPERVFIPRSVSEDANGAYTYRSKVYYLQNDDADQEDKSVKHVKEDQGR